MNAIELNLFSSRITAICDEMGAVLRRAAFSPNIKDRLDFSCAIFDAHGALVAQAAHIPVHLGSMAYAMKDIVQTIAWQPGDMLIVNDPYLGGTHLPDVTLIAPVFHQQQLCAFVCNRAHHADIGASSPGSMPVSSTLDEEGMVIAPTHLLRAGRLDESLLASILVQLANPHQGRGDLSAQISANQTGVTRLQVLLVSMNVAEFVSAVDELNSYAERLARAALADIPLGEYNFSDRLDDDGQGNTDVVICAKVQVNEQGVHVDFSGTAPQVAGNINCPLSVAAAGVYYVFRCLMPAQTPACAGAFRPITLSAPVGCLLNAQRPAAVAAGNVETSSRVVDVIMGALVQAIPQRLAAASQGTMNNLAMGGRSATTHWDYYETMGGGAGASPAGNGLSARQTHMTNTLNTPIESVEMHYPLRVTQYAIRRGSGGAGKYRGGDGLVREFEFLADASVTLLTERRRLAPWGCAGGQPGATGENNYDGQLLEGKKTFTAKVGKRLTIKTPGGGGWGE